MYLKGNKLYLASDGFVQYNVIENKKPPSEPEIGGST